MFTIIMVFSIIICLVVIAVTALTTSKAYGFKHTVDSLENNPHISNANENETDIKK